MYTFVSSWNTLRTRALWKQAFRGLFRTIRDGMHSLRHILRMKSAELKLSLDTSTATGKRNLTIFRPASRMGLRAEDIARLKLSEIDFGTEHINVIQGKTGMYFMAWSPPYDRITTGIIRHALNECFIVTNINTVEKHGTHTFRSALVSSMINDGTLYDVVRRILGHSAPDVIKHYAKVDIDNLRLCSKKPPLPTERFCAYLSGKEVGGYVWQHLLLSDIPVLRFTQRNVERQREEAWFMLFALLWRLNCRAPKTYGCTTEAFMNGWALFQGKAALLKTR